MKQRLFVLTVDTIPLLHHFSSAPHAKGSVVRQFFSAHVAKRFSVEYVATAQITGTIIGVYLLIDPPK
jgi:hypothetical protein